MAAGKAKKEILIKTRVFFPEMRAFVLVAKGEEDE
jgi:hypothetical protein